MYLSSSRIKNLSVLRNDPFTYVLNYTNIYIIYSSSPLQVKISSMKHSGAPVKGMLTFCFCNPLMLSNWLIPIFYILNGSKSHVWTKKHIFVLSHFGLNFSLYYPKKSSNMVYWYFNIMRPTFGIHHSHFMKIFCLLNQKFKYLTHLIASSLYLVLKICLFT